MLRFVFLVVLQHVAAVVEVLVQVYVRKPVLPGVHMNVTTLVKVTALAVVLMPAPMCVDEAVS